MLSEAEGRLLCVWLRWQNAVDCADFESRTSASHVPATALSATLSFQSPVPELNLSLDG